MAITLTDSTGRQYHFCGAEEQLLQAVLTQNLNARRQLIAAVIDFDSRRMQLMADVLAGQKVGDYGRHLEPADVGYKKMALGWISNEYTESMEHLRATLGTGIDEEIQAARSTASTRTTRQDSASRPQHLLHSTAH